MTLFSQLGVKLPLSNVGCVPCTLGQERSLEKAFAWCQECPIKCRIQVHYVSPLIGGGRFVCFKILLNSCCWSYKPPNSSVCSREDLIMESLRLERLEKTSQIILSNCLHTTNIANWPHPSVPCLHSFGTPPWMVTPSLPEQPVAVLLQGGIFS